METDFNDRNVPESREGGVHSRLGDCMDNPLTNWNWETLGVCCRVLGMTEADPFESRLKGGMWSRSRDVLRELVLPCGRAEGDGCSFKKNKTRV